MGYFSRRRSFLIKLVVIVSTAWFTIAFLLYSENRQPINTLHAIEPALPNAQALKKDNEKVESNQVKDLEKNDPLKVENEIEEEENKREEEIKKNEEQGGFLKMPGQSDYGEMGKPVVLPKNLTADIKKIVDEGWSKNAFNQYASDLISIKRALPDPRDEW